MPVGHLMSSLVPSHSDFNRCKPKDELGVEVDVRRFTVLGILEMK